MPAPTSVCPRCATTLLPGQSICSCGQAISSSGASGDALLVQAETLFESYLLTRVRSAERALQAARVDLARRPTSANLSARVYELTRELKTAETRLSDQRLRTDSARQRAIHAADASTSAPEAFRQAQSAKADIALAHHQLERLREAVAAGEPAAQFDAKTAAHAERIMKNRDREATPCPACGLPLPGSASHCGCGYAVTREVQDPDSEFLSTEEIAALRRAR